MAGFFDPLIEACYPIDLLAFYILLNILAKISAVIFGLLQLGIL